MSELHVGSGHPYPTLVAAANAARSGDVVTIHAGVYPHGFQPPANTTWRAAPGESVVIDGGWEPSQRVLPQDANANGILIKNPGVTLVGIEVRRVRGRGVTVAAGGDNFLMENCEIHHTVNGGFGANGTGTPIVGITIRGCYAHDTSLSGKWQPAPVNGAFLFKMCRDVLVEDTVSCRSFGEGFAFGSRSDGCTARRVEVHTTAHLCFYVANRACNVLMEDCVAWQPAASEFRQRDGEPGACYVVGDEESGAKDNKWQHSENVIMRRCVAVNGSSLFQLRNGMKPGKLPGEHDGYNTRIQNLRAENCSFVSGPDTKLGVNIGENDLGARVGGEFVGNLFVLDQMRGDGPAVHRFKVEAKGIEFAGNAWTVLPAGLPASNVSVAATALVAPWATVPAAGLVLDNYRPVAGGQLDGAGYGALDVLPVEPPPPPPPDPDPEPPPDPEPEPPDGPEPPLPEPDWRQRLNEREQVLVANCQGAARAVPIWLPDWWVYELLAKLADILDEKK